MSEEKEIVETRDGLILDWQALSGLDDNTCWLVALSWRDLSVILSSLRYASWRARWRPVDNATWEQITDYTQTLEGCLLMGCNVQDLIITQRLLIGAITGTVVDLDEELPQTGSVDFSNSGLATKFLSTDEPQRNVADILADLNEKLEELGGVIAAGEDLEDDLANVWGTIQIVAQILGASQGVPVPPL